ncbi:MAG: DUF2797 domain-containing protein [bacterium]
MTTSWSGTLRKMRVEHTDPVSYRLADGFFDRESRSEDLELNDLLGHAVELRFTGVITCVFCGRKTKKSFGQGFCYPCFSSRAEADICIVKPELCHYFDPNDPCRDDSFAQAHCFQPHILYVSLTSGRKVGITRQSNLPDRWIDQGAVSAIPLAELPNRREVGLVEHELAKQYRDKTHWMTMLKEERPDKDLAARAAEILAELEAREVDGILPASARQEAVFRYPVLEYPTKVKSFNLDKTDLVAGTLRGIKGQYLILDNGVINLRKFTGYAVVFRATPV